MFPRTPDVYGQRLAVLAAIVLLFLVGSRVLADSTVLVQGSIEAGTEYDSNPGHVEKIDGEESIAGAPLLRLQGRLRLGWSPHPQHSLFFAGNGATKQFLTKSGRQENAFAITAAAGYRFLPSEDMDAMLVTRYRGIFGDRLFGRDAGYDRGFSLVELTPSWGVHLQNLTYLLIRATSSAFFYAPDRNQDWLGIGGQFQFKKTIPFGSDKTGLGLAPDISLRNLEIVGAYTIGFNRHNENTLINGCPLEAPAPDCILPGEKRRREVRHTLSTSLTFSSASIYSFLYQFQFIDSNSFGYSSLRHRFELSASTELPASIFVTVKGVLLYNTFVDPLLLSRDVLAQDFVAIDDENRNALILHLTRDIGNAWNIEAKYAIYSNEFATEHVSFRRQIVFLGFGYRFGE